MDETVISHKQAGSTLSYKFQRLRERIREAIDRGELTGKLPGERALAKTFQVNAKTLSKALTDLAAEGVLDRSIGRGTYVKGTAPAASTTGRWLVLTDDGPEPAVVQALRAANNQLAVMNDPVDGVRPSFINQFCAVIDLASDTPENFLRDMVVRNIPVIAVGREPKTYSMNAVVLDRLLGASRLTRELLLAGHRNFAVISQTGDTSFIEAVRQTTRRFVADSAIDSIYANEVASAIQNGATAIVCDSADSARDVMTVLKTAGIATPDRVSVVAVGVTNGQAPCTGYYASPQQLAKGVTDLLGDQSVSRPTVLWLAGELVDQRTSGMSKATPGAIEGAAARTFGQQPGRTLEA
jgi:hypothetical protein